MIRRTGGVKTCILWTAASLIPAVAAGESFLDFHLGAAYTIPEELHAREEIGARETLSVAADSPSDLSLALGLRFGHWFESVPWFGLAFDVSYFSAEGGPIERNDVFPISTLVMFRLPLLKSEELPNGRLQPYIGFGPGLFVYDASVDLRPLVSEPVRHTSIDLGFDGRLGLAWQFGPSFALLTEYRFTYFKQNLESGGAKIDYVGSRHDDVEADAKFFTHCALIGFSIRF